MRESALLLVLLAGSAAAAAEPLQLEGFEPDGHTRLQLAGDKLQSTVFVPSFRVAFQIAGKVTASTRESYALGTTRSGTRVTANTVLEGVDLALMQQITDRAYADFQARLAARGYTQLEPAAWMAAASASRLDWGKHSTPEAVVTVESNNGVAESAYVLVVPSGQRNWPETTMPANLGALRGLTRELQATPIIPRLVVNYVQMRSSGKGKSGFFSRGSEVSTAPLLHAAAYAGGFSFDIWRARVGQHGGFVDFLPEAVLSVPGDFVSIDESDGDESTRAGNMANAITWALAGVGNFAKAQYLTYRADAPRYAQMAEQVLAMQSEALLSSLAPARR